MLERYARLFSCVEINSSFYRSHRPATYARWAASVPPEFRFSLKLPKEITHRRRLADSDELVAAFLDETEQLGDKRGPLLVQLPPSFGYNDGVVEAFFVALRARYHGALACEPRHASWFEPNVDAVLRAFQVARVAADPAPVATAQKPGGWDGFAYWRLHGSPRVYYSAYERAALEAYAAVMRTQTAPVWCIFDNTAFGEATADALELDRLLAGG